MLLFGQVGNKKWQHMWRTISKLDKSKTKKISSCIDRFFTTREQRDANINPNEHRKTVHIIGWSSCYGSHLNKQPTTPFSTHRSTGVACFCPPHEFKSDIISPFKALTWALLCCTFNLFLQTTNSLLLPVMWNWRGSVHTDCFCLLQMAACRFIWGRKAKRLKHRICC